MIIYGVNPVLEALRAQRVRRVRVASRHDKRIQELVTVARQRGVTVERVDAQALDRLTRGGVHQGVAADVDEAREFSVSDLLDPESTGRVPLLIVLDGIEDPHNVGAILRTADAAGATGVIRQSRHAATLDGVVAKASAGALATARIATVVNIARAIEELKEAGVWTVGLADAATDDYTDVDLTLATAIVLGAEGSGLRRLVSERCDRLVRIPMAGAVSSLNVSVAAGVILYEAVRQRVNAVHHTC
ncbi:MAG TPA: 23S rRNA (guanosine(2251)-2'-O)-methyltransferase RlmB [Vicinamibacterales bacterium]|jgi:23S rRNA (guanosine2251-2'-O)-methyltransferase|nr:23S rRNA (guanosine(2251)-2'-O)-methyltransferase RlmB [Vicinamibacterales bacterium]